MKIFKIFFLAIALPFISFSQVQKVSLQAAGLTCSLCSNSINKALKALSNIDKVNTNLETSTFEISFKDGNKVDFDQLQKAVEKAGFSVAKMLVSINVGHLSVDNDQLVIIGGKTFHFLGIKNQTLDGLQTLMLVDKGFVNLKTFNKYASLTKMDCIKTGKDIATGTRIFHVTI